ncbi:hypothetical protein PR048_023012 [Dryococelus australis]|uniref:Uncharacterized protein n=1 Tax=Dryococelus australis TaxID=614101 RepID=A0ABQ9GSW0_9NEOP|nr:hypothetical protein PR048_023012 [Dryococelus australis]
MCVLQLSNENDLTSVQVYNAYDTGLLWKCLPNTTLAGGKETSAPGFNHKDHRKENLREKGMTRQHSRVVIRPLPCSSSSTSREQKPNSPVPATKCDKIDSANGLGHHSESGNALQA